MIENFKFIGLTDDQQKDIEKYIESEDTSIKPKWYFVEDPDHEKDVLNIARNKDGRRIGTKKAIRHSEAA
jgi:hypothetical protein